MFVWTLWMKMYGMRRKLDTQASIADVSGTIPRCFRMDNGGGGVRGPRVHRLLRQLRHPPHIHGAEHTPQQKDRRRVRYGT